MSQRAPVSVSEALTQARRSLEAIRLRVIGEVSDLADKAGYKAVYFSIRDKESTMPCLMWCDPYRACGIQLRSGMLVVLDGNFSAYVPKGRLQFVVSRITPAGEGELRLRVAERARMLQAEGLMDPARKRPVPTFPKRIALVTSPRGKAVHDVIRTLQRRYPVAELLIAGINVEGPHAVTSIVTGLTEAIRSKPDVILLVRGGGSYEDLLPFSEEVVVRAVATSPVPIVTGIGHEPDTSIADMVADVSASTPTAAAEAVSPSTEEISRLMLKKTRMLSRALTHGVDRAGHRVQMLKQRTPFRDPMSLLAHHLLKADSLQASLAQALPRGLEAKEAAFLRVQDRLLHVGAFVTMIPASRLESAVARLHDLSPLATLGRGYSVCTSSATGRLIRSVEDVDSGQEVLVRVTDGQMRCMVDDVERA
ncbi:MAG: exodeoxyribonuclease VII large subunit [Actinobacteria bacterium]|nr:exodeoxyribonuclease VII large subunit [Actinomycetota bacterium]